MNTVLITKPIEVNSRLHELGVSEEILRSAVEAGERARLGCTANHPRMTPGFVGWSDTVKLLRDRLIPEKWTKHDTGGLPTVVHPKGMISIAVTTGDEGTGIETRELRSKYSKGSATAALVEVNHTQLGFDEEILGPRLFKKPSGTILTWYLVIRRLADEIRFELSLPSGLSENGQVAEWKERILFAPITLDDDAVKIDNTIEEVDDIVVEVTRKF
ncbi:hypothetical protein [Pseudobdellovibrio sp. HCB154]|uniref:hypothetical protein n=1 Tax=Pseudobdellovibrio sp. HCB154 TaxID=3386277 RepID=UPI0039173085